MIITKQKPYEEILSQIGGNPVFLIGCSECAALCHTGGEQEVIKMKHRLENNNIPVTGWVVLDPACHLLNDKRLLRQHKENIEKARKILVLACGNGVQTVSEIITSAEKIISGTDTLFLGEILHPNEFEKRCIQCGVCIVDRFSGFCPISRCPKHMLNGPCGGSQDGFCEINKDTKCVWEQIYEKMLKNNYGKQLKHIIPPQDWSKSTVMRRAISHVTSK